MQNSRVWDISSDTSPRFPLAEGHDNEADFLGFLQKLVPHRSLTLPFQPLHFWLQIHRDIRNQKRLPTQQVNESGSQRLSVSASRVVTDFPTQKVGESAFECLQENSASWRVVDSLTRQFRGHHGESRSRYSNFLKFSIDFLNFKQLDQPF